MDLSSSEFDSVEEREAKLENEKRDSSSSRASKSSEEDDLDYLIDSLNDDIDGGDYDDDFDFIEVERPREISDEELARITDVDVVNKIHDFIMEQPGDGLCDEELLSRFYLK